MNVVSPFHFIAAPVARLALLVLVATGCAGSGTSDPSEGSGMVVQWPDAGPARDAQTVDAAPQDTAAPLCEVCCPGDRRCDGRGMRQVCRADGRGFDDAACTEQEICQNGEDRKSVV